MIKILLKEKYFPFFTLAFALSVHLLMLLRDLSNTTIFFNADRALSRWNTMQGIIDAFANNQATDFLISHGVIGDYIFHAILLELGGKFGLILFQVGIALLSGWGVYRIGHLIGLSVRQSSLAAGIYLFLPHTLVFPHQLITEALHTPFLVISLWLTIEFLRNGRGNTRCLIIGALLVGIATLIRPITLLWPMIVGLTLMRGTKVRFGAIYLVLAYLPILLWMGFIGTQTGKFGFGKSPHDMEHNLYQRVLRISDAMPSEQAEQTRKIYLNQGEKGTLGTVAYFRFATDYPFFFAQHLARDIIVLVGKSGVERISIDYLELNKTARTQFQDGRTGWRKILAEQGLMGVVHYFWQNDGQVLIISLLGSILMLFMIIVAIVGGWRLVLSNRKEINDRYIIWLLISLPLYTFLFSQVVDYVQSRHRATSEAAIVLLAVYGVVFIMKRLTAQIKKSETSS